MAQNWNNLNKAFYGLLSGGQQIGQGLMAKSIYNDSAQKLKDAYAKLLNDNMQTISTPPQDNPQSNISVDANGRPTAGTEVPGPNTAFGSTQTVSNPTLDAENRAGLVQNLYNSIMPLSMLGQSGKVASQGLSAMYEAMNPPIDDTNRYDLHTGANGTYLIDKRKGTHTLVDKAPEKPTKEENDVIVKEGDLTNTYRYNKSEKPFMEDGVTPNPKYKTLVKSEPNYHTPTSGRSGYRGSSKIKTENLTNKEKEIQADLATYSKYMENPEGNAELIKGAREKYASQGINIDEEYNRWQSESSKSSEQEGLLGDIANREYAKNEAHNQIYDEIKMDNWWSDMYGANDINELNDKYNYYADYMNTELKNIDPDVWNMLWSTFQKSYDNVKRDKKF